MMTKCDMWVGVKSFYILSDILFECPLKCLKITQEPLLLSQ